MLQLVLPIGTHVIWQTRYNGNFLDRPWNLSELGIYECFADYALFHENSHPLILLPSPADGRGSGEVCHDQRSDNDR